MPHAEPNLANAPPQSRRPITTTDLLKVVGLLLVFVDHYALFFDPDEGWWRVPGRLAAPLFFFFIGFARSRQVPMAWLWLGAGLTAIDVLTSEEGLSGLNLNILFNFAALRLALPWVETRVMPHPARLVLLVGATLLVIQPVGLVLEYGAEGWLWALFGLARRLEGDGCGGRVARLRGLALGATAALAYWVTEVADLDLEGAKGGVLALLLLLLLLALVTFRRRDVAWTPPPPLGAAFRFSGRRSLEIYAASLAGMQVLDYLRE